MASGVVSISFRNLLHEVCCRLPVSMPIYNAPVVNEGVLTIRVDVEIFRGDSLSELISCWSVPCSNEEEAGEDAARSAVMRLRSEFGFEVKDISLDEMKAYENLCGQISAESIVLHTKYRQLSEELDFLKNCCSTLLAEREQYIVDRKKVRETLENCLDLIKDSKFGTTELRSRAAAFEE